jgi:acid phosphatase type 7
VLTGSDGSIVTQAAAVRDTSAHPTGGAVQWSAALTGLQPDTSYCYQVTSGETALQRGGFRTASAAGSGRPIRFVAFGDSGDGGSDQRAVRDQMETVPFDFMIHLGDIAYEEGTRQQLEHVFFDVYADLLETFPVFPASGNHEYGSEDAAPFREAFMLPENGGPAGRERWYSYDWGDVHFVALDSERIGSPQAQWLDADLTANHLPWTIVYLHRPPFSSGEHGSNAEAQRLFVPVLARHRVPLVLSGHDHSYERTRPIDGVTYVVSGGGGRGTRKVGHSSFTAFSEAVCHFLYITVAGDELTVHAIDGTGQEFDSLLLRRRD